MSNTRYNTTELLLAAAVGIFETGKTVTIALFDAFDGSAIPLDTFHPAPDGAKPGNECFEIGATGIFRWPLSVITTIPTTFKQLIYVMTDNSTIPVVRREMVDLLGWSDSLLSGIPADMCKVTTLVFRPDDQAGVTPNRLLSDVEKAYAEIQGTYFQPAPGKHFDTARQKPYYLDTGEAFWLLPQGSTVKFFIKQLNINQDALIPAQSTIDLDSLLNP